jgi:glycosyltransferase involved in cell wall biosynthesis
LTRFPLPSSEKSGWPWAEILEQMPEKMPDGSPWPKISVVTPSYNQGQFIEETIRSVLLQGYPNLEFIIIDGGSTDNSVEIIKKYAPWLNYWVSEPDEGQSQAINKGFKLASGEIVAWINSDDTYNLNAFATVAPYLNQSRKADIVFSDLRIVDEEGKQIRMWSAPEHSLESLICDDRIGQPTVFMRRELLNVVGLLNENLHFSMDHEYWCRVALNGYQLTYINAVLANFRVHNQSKSVTQKIKFYQDQLTIYDNLFQNLGLKNNLRSIKHKTYCKAYLRCVGYYRSPRLRAGHRLLILKYWLLAFINQPHIALEKKNLHPSLLAMLPDKLYQMLGNLWRSMKAWVTR